MMSLCSVMEQCVRPDVAMCYCAVDEGDVWWYVVLLLCGVGFRGSCCLVVSVRVSLYVSTDVVMCRFMLCLVVCGVVYRCVFTCCVMSYCVSVCCCILSCNSVCRDV